MMERKNTSSIRRIILFTCMLSSSGASLGGGLSGIQQLKSFKVHSTGHISAVGFNRDWNNPDACDQSNRVALPPGHKFYKEIYASIISAHGIERDIKFRLAGCTEINGILYPKIREAEVY